MKKYLILTIILILVASGGYFIYSKYFRISNRMNPIYGIPADAAYIIELDNPLESWNKISKSDVWNYLKKNEFIEEITHMADSLDEEIRSNETLYKYIGTKPVIMSGHPVKGKLEYFYVFDLQEASQFIGFRNLLLPTLESYYTVNIRKYKDFEILELYDEEYHETLYLSIVENLLMATYRHNILENALDQLAEPVIGRDLAFIRVKENLGYDGLLRLYFQWSVMIDYISENFEDQENLNDIKAALSYSGFDMNYDQDTRNIEFNGYTSTNDTVTNLYTIFNKISASEMNIPEVLTGRAAVYNGFGFGDSEKLSSYLTKLIKNSYPDYEESKRKLESYLKINMEENFFSWMEDEMAAVKIYNEEGGDEYGLIIKSKDSTDAVENLNYLSEQVRKKTPVKFKTINYRGYQVNFMSVKGFFKLLMGNFAKEMDKPYYTVIGDYVIFSNKPSTLRIMIDDYLGGNTLIKEEEFRRYSELYEEEKHAFLYANTDYLIRDAKNYLDQETFGKLNRNAEYFLCFPRLALQIIADDGLYESKVILPYRNLATVRAWVNALKSLENLQRPTNLKDTLDYDSVFSFADQYKKEEESIVPEDILPDDLDAKTYQEFYESGQLKIEVGLKNGQKHGSYLEYNENGNLILKGRYRNDLMDGVWKSYDSLGNLIERKRYRDGEAR